MAIIVGIERYDQHWGCLDGPASDACRFAGWLLERGVLAGNITLLTAALERNLVSMDRFRERGVRVLEATAEAVRTRLITELPQQRSAHLLIYWGGHGVIRDDEKLFVWPEATKDDPRGFSLTQLLRFLRSSHNIGHPLQQILVDTCAQFTNRDMRYEILPVKQLTVPDQQTYIAASDDEIAENSKSRKTGLFSEAVLEALRALPSETWPPDLAAVEDHVTAKFNCSRAADPSAQTPHSIWFKAGAIAREELRYTIRAASRDATAEALDLMLLTQQESQDLRKLLRAVAVPDSLRAIYRESVGLINVPSPENFDDLWSLVTSLRKPMSAEPLFGFLVRLAASTADQVARDRLWDWLTRVAPSYVDLDRLRGLGDQVNRDALLVRLEEDLVDPGYRVTMWRYRGAEGQQSAVSSEPWSLDTIAARLTDQLDGRYDPDLPPLVEFLVPTGLIDLTFENLPIDSNGHAVLGSLCPVVVRPLDRRRNHEWHTTHQGVWPAVAALDSYDPAAICWVEQIDIDSAALRGHVCAALAWGTHPSPQQKEQLLTNLFRAGTPIALWHRAPRASGRVILNEILKGQALLELPDIVLEKRRSSRAESAPPDHAGRDLVLLWDDPSRGPDVATWHAPTSTGAR